MPNLIGISQRESSGSVELKRREKMGVNDWQKVKTDKKMVLGRYIVADPKVCHGKLTFRGTRIFVAQVLEQVSRGITWDTISESWGGAVSQEAIAEAVRLSREALLKYWPQMEIPDTEVT